MDIEVLAFFKKLIMHYIKKLKLFSLFFLLSAYSFAQTDNYQPPKLSAQNSWSMVLIPDVQSYVKFERNHGVLELMTGWVSDQIESLNIQMVLGTGDLVEHNSWLTPDGERGDQAGLQQWKAVSRAFERLDGKVPYINATGNHDYGVLNIDERRKTNYDTFFPVDRNLLSQRLLKEAGMDADQQPSLVNAAYEFLSPTEELFLFVVLEFAPREETIEWAKKVVEDEKYANHRVVVLTHSYLNSENAHIAQENYPIENRNYGKAIFDKLVKPSKNIEMVFSGHIGKPDDFEKHVGYRTDKNAAGRTVHQITFNAQALGGGWFGNGGDGWLRWFEFMPDKRTVKVKTFSPLFAISPTTRQYAWHREDYNEFEFKLDPK